MIRFCDIFLSGIGLVLLFPLFLILGIWIKIDSNGPVFYKQERVGKGSVAFSLFKFRSMQIDSDKKGLITVGSHDPRVTRSGYFIRKFKLDELPQLINVFFGDMSLVGPRPEVRKYVDLYNEEQRYVLSIRPGITDYASIAFSNENEMLSSVSNPEQYYIDVIMPEKLRLNMGYIQNRNLFQYFKIIAITIGKIIG
jgi:lipopolysaccharide/colanic/teichoic acid biosynthesis glycosyltransferase